MSVETKLIRNVAVVGHNGTGKTSLVEQMLYYTGAISKAEKVDSGKTVSDYTEEEITRKISVHTSLNSTQWLNKTINILDTPGTADFVGEAICSFRTAESAIMTVDARDGAQIETIKLWRRLDQRKKPRAVFINKMDKERANSRDVLDNLTEEFNSNFAPVTIPMGYADEFKGVINLIENKAYFITANGKEEIKDVPAEYAENVSQYREELIEKAAEGSDDLIEKFFEEGTLNDDEIRRGLREGLKNDSVVPVFVGASDKGSGIISLLNFISNNFPSPEGVDEYIIKEDGTEVRDYPIGAKSTAEAYCFKTTIDQFSGKLSFIKVVNGFIGPDTDLYNLEDGKKGRPGKIYRALGKKLIEIDGLNAGDIGIITKFDPAKTNSTLVGDANDKIKFMALRLPQPIYELAISASDKKSEDKMNDALHRITEEDLTFEMKYNEETKESIIGGMGELHINMILDKIRDKQKIQINTKTPKIAYRETITKKSGLSEYSHKKQSGGHGQFGRVVIEISPIERGQYYFFENTVKGGAVSKGYVPGIEKGIHEKMNEGFLAGYPLVDIGINLVDGKEHPVDSSEMAFKLAAKGAMDVALAKAGCVLLEPYCKLEVFVDQEYLGAILSDLSGRRGRVLGQEDMGHLTSVKAEVPMAELRSYAIDLKSMTQGSGSFELEFDHYETLNGKLAEDVINEAKREREALEA